MYDNLKKLVKTAYGPSYSLPPRQTAAQQPIRRSDLNNAQTPSSGFDPYSDTARLGTSGRATNFSGLSGNPDLAGYRHYMGRAYNPWYDGKGPTEDTVDDALRWGGRAAGGVGALAGATAGGVVAAPAVSAAYATYGAPVAAGAITQANKIPEYLQRGYHTANRVARQAAHKAPELWNKGRQGISNQAHQVPDRWNQGKQMTQQLVKHPRHTTQMTAHKLRHGIDAMRDPGLGDTAESIYYDGLGVIPTAYDQSQVGSDVVAQSAHNTADANTVRNLFKHR